MDKSQFDNFETGIIQAMIEKHRPNEESKVVYLIGIQDEKVILTTSDNDKGRLITYPLTWIEACFIGYCLIVEASKLVAMDKISAYFKELAERRNELIEWFDENKKFFDILKKRRGR